MYPWCVGVSLVCRCVPGVCRCALDVDNNSLTASASLYVIRLRLPYPYNTKLRNQRRYTTHIIGFLNYWFTDYVFVGHLMHPLFHCGVASQGHLFCSQGHVSCWKHHHNHHILLVPSREVCGNAVPGNYKIQLLKGQNDGEQ